jgi:Holliday junction resolvase RusA-like endonuclease
MPWIEKASFFVEGLPKAQPRPRFGNGHAYNPPSADGWKAAVEVAAREHFKDKKTLEGPVCVHIMAMFPGLKKGGEWHVKKPDLDNVVKAIMDALTTAGAWKDDSQVADLHASKGYSGQAGGKVGAAIAIGGWE